MTSDLKSHKFTKGLVITPMNNIQNMEPVSWTNDRLPEYIWLGLIIMNFDRTKGIEKAGKILKEIAQINKLIIKPKLSSIFSLPETEQEKIYKIICKEIDPKCLAPLTVIYRNSSYPVFNKYFNLSDIFISTRINVLSDAIKLYYDHQSYEATDLRYVVISMMIFQEKLSFHQGSEIPEALVNYPYTDHDDEKMRLYRPCIRVTEMTDFENLSDKDFTNNFWKEIGMKTNCNIVAIELKNIGIEMNYKEYISSIQERIYYLLHEHKEQSIYDDKFSVLIGSFTYALKIFNEVITKELSDCILGRHALRTIIETYINIKYLLKIESEHPNIWEEYKLYGVGKYKLPLLKARETQINDKSHFIEPLVNVIVNEIFWEEFINIDLRYFDKKGIRERFEIVDERDLYDIFYDYDTNFVHGFWGAIRESSMLHCDNATHQYHTVPDISFEQKLADINHDIYSIIEKFSNLIDELYK